MFVQVGPLFFNLMRAQKPWLTGPAWYADVGLAIWRTAPFKLIFNFGAGLLRVVLNHGQRFVWIVGRS